MPRYNVDIEEDNGFGGIGIIAAAVVIAIMLYAAIYIGIPALIIYIIYRIVKYNKEQKSLAHTKCPKCKKLKALQAQKEQVVKERLATKKIYNKQTQQYDSFNITEVVTRKYEKCIFCGEMTYTDVVSTKL